MQPKDLPWHNLDFMSKDFLRAPSERMHVARTADTHCDATFVFFHGVLRDWRSFYPILGELRGLANLVAVDFRGHGQSLATPNAYRVVDYVADAIEVIRQTPGRLVVYGHSLGAMVALAACAQAPERIETVILEDPPFSTMGQELVALPLMQYFREVERCVHEENLLSDGKSPDNQSFDGRVSRLFHSFSNIVVGEKSDGSPLRLSEQRDELSRRFSAETLARLDPQVFRPITSGQWMDGYDLTGLLKDIAARVVLLQADGQCGGMLSDREAEQVCTSLGDRCKRIQFAGVGHSISWARPHSIIDTIRSAFA